MHKKIRNSTQVDFHATVSGLRSVDMFHQEFGFEPFLVFTEFHMSEPVFGPHPHAGISVMTYMLPDSKGSFLNRDSQGDHSTIEPGGIHVTQAGSGIKHDEVPTVRGLDCHGFQIWINHREADRMVTPNAFHAAANEVPEYKTEQVLLRVVQGRFEQLSSPIELLTKTSLFDITLQPTASIELPAAEMAFIYLMSGNLHLADTSINGRNLLSFEEAGTKVLVSAGETPAHFMFASGTPHNEPIIHGGPFVMTTQEQMLLTKQRLHRGEMGELTVMAAV